MNWTRSSYCSAGTCVEVATTLTWHRSRSCANGACCEVAVDGGTVYLRDSKNPDQPPLTYSVNEWRTNVLNEIREGGRLPEATYRLGETVVVRRKIGGAKLTFTDEEWDTFVDGVRNGQFDPERLAA